MGATHSPRPRLAALGLVVTIGAGAAIAGRVSDGGRVTPRALATERSTRVVRRDPEADDGGEENEAARRPFTPQRADNHVLTGLPSAPRAGLQWTFLGPRPINNLRGNVNGLQTWGNNSGRITALATQPGTPATVYAGTAGGGVWSSTDGGTHWLPRSDTAASLSIGALAIDAAGTTLIAGTGEENYSESMPGQGMLVSTDSGATWTNTARTTFGNRYIGSLAIDRTTSGAHEKVYAATNLGLFVSTDTGSTWSKVAQFSTVAPGYAFQVTQDPTTATTWWATEAAPMNACGNAHVLVSKNNGPWSAVLTVPNSSRIGLGVGTGGVAYTAAANCAGKLAALKRTANTGTSWATTTAPVDFFDATGSSSGQGWYDNAVAVDPTDNNRAVFAGVNIVATTNGGTSWLDIGKVFGGGHIHPDFHAIAFTGANSFYVGNDGGVWKTTNLGSAFTNLNATLGVTQFYRGAVSDLNHVIGGSQDNAVAGRIGSSVTTWQEYGAGGDGAYTAVDPTTGSTTVYAESQTGDIARATAAAAFPGTPAAPCGGCTGHAFISPFVMDPSNPKRLLAPAPFGGGTQAVAESRNNATYTGGVPSGYAPTGGWTVISPSAIGPVNDPIVDLTVGPSGEGQIVYALTQSGLVRRSFDALGARVMPSGVSHWVDATGDLSGIGTPIAGWAQASSIVFNPWNINEVWVTMTAIGTGTSPVWHTTNANAVSPTWTPLTNATVANMPGAGLAVDPRNPKILYLGTSAGVYRCTTCGGSGAAANWIRYGIGLPNVWVNDLRFTRDHANLVAFTHGRGAWAMPTPDSPAANVITEYPITGGAAPGAMVAGPNGPWFVDSGTGKIGHVAANGTVTQYTVAGAGDQLQALVVGPDGNIWYTAANGNYIGMIKPNGTGNVHYPLPTAGARPYGIAFGGDGNLWITENATSSVDQFRPLLHTWGIRVGTITHFSHPEFATQGADGNVWFTEFTGLKVAKVDNAGTVTEYNAPVNSGDTTGPYGIGLGPDGKVWFTNYTDNSITSVSTAGAMHTVYLGTGIHGPISMTAGYDGNVWVADGGAQSVVAKIDPTTSLVTKYTLPTAFAYAYGIVTGPDGNIWFTEAQHGSIAKLQLSQS